MGVKILYSSPDGHPEAEELFIRRTKVGAPKKNTIFAIGLIFQLINHSIF